MIIPFVEYFWEFILVHPNIKQKENLYQQNLYFNNMRFVK